MHEETKGISNDGLAVTGCWLATENWIFGISALLGHYMDVTDTSLHCNEEADLPKVNSTLA